jgi:hypothetical protein
MSASMTANGGERCYAEGRARITGSRYRGTDGIGFTFFPKNWMHDRIAGKECKIRGCVITAG